MKAVVMAGGKGARLMPYTAVLPKPLMPLAGMPILEVVLRQLRRHGIREVVLSVNHLHHLIRSFFGNGAALGLSIEYFIEDKPLGTCGCLGAMLDMLSDDFILMNGDVLTNIDFTRMVDSHRAAGAAATIATHNRVFKVEFGVLSVADDGLVDDYVEKPEYHHNISMGIYVIDRRSAQMHLMQCEYKDTPSLIMDLVRARNPVLNYTEDCLWLDIGNPNDYALAQEIAGKHPALLGADLEPADRTIADRGCEPGRLPASVDTSCRYLASTGDPEIRVQRS